MVSIEVCIPSRDERLDLAGLGRVQIAVAHALSAGMAATLEFVRDPYGVVQARNKGVAGFLSRDKTHLLMVDDDVGLPANALTGLAAAAEKHQTAVIAGCVPAIRVRPDGTITSYVQVRELGGGWRERWFSGAVEAEVVGGGCMLLPRGLFAELGFPWFRWPETYRGMGQVEQLSDDADLCQRVRALGRQVWAVGGVRCSHRKAIDVAWLIGND